MLVAAGGNGKVQRDTAQTEEAMQVRIPGNSWLCEAGTGQNNLDQGHRLQEHEQTGHPDTLQVSSKLGRVDRAGQEQLVKERRQEHGSHSPDPTAMQKEATRAATASPMGKYQIFAGIFIHTFRG